MSEADRSGLARVPLTSSEGIGLARRMLSRVEWAILARLDGTGLARPIVGVLCLIGMGKSAKPAVDGSLCTRVRRLSSWLAMKHEREQGAENLVYKELP